jgi:hypothetical protein
MPGGELPPADDAELWEDKHGTAARILENSLRLIDTMQSRSSETAEVAEAIAATRDAGGLRVRPQSLRERWTAGADFLSLLVQRFLRIRKSTGRYDAQKAMYFLERIFRFGFLTDHAPARLGMFDRNLHAIERAAAAAGLLHWDGKEQYIPDAKLAEGADRALQEQSTDPDLTQKVVDYLASHSYRLEMWGMVDHAAQKLIRDGRRVSAPAVLGIINAEPEWSWKGVTLRDVEDAMTELLQLELLPPEEVDLVPDPEDLAS